MHDFYKKFLSIFHQYNRFRFTNSYMHFIGVDLTSKAVFLRLIVISHSNLIDDV
jgi:hypothetical protein